MDYMDTNLTVHTWRQRLVSWWHHYEWVLHPFMVMSSQIYFVIFSKWKRALTTRHQSCGKVMFSVVFVCRSVFSQGFPFDHYPWCLGPNHTGTPSSICSNLFNLDLTVQGPPYPSSLPPLLYRDPLVPALPPDMLKPVYYGEYTVRKQEVGILLESFLLLKIVYPIIVYINTNWNPP